MGCSSSVEATATAAPASCGPENGGKSEKETTKTEQVKPEPAAAQDASEASVAPQPDKQRRMSAKTRVKNMCDEGWLEIAEAYCACMSENREWGSSEADAALRERGGEVFENARLTFGAKDWFLSAAFSSALTPLRACTTPHRLFFIRCCPNTMADVFTGRKIRCRWRPAHPS